MEYVLEEVNNDYSPYDQEGLDVFLRRIATDAGMEYEQMMAEMPDDIFDALLSSYAHEKEKRKNMTNKSFMMKAYNRLYTLEFSIDPVSRVTTITAIDAETDRMSFFQRLQTAIGILFGKTKIADLVFPLNLRSADFYNMSFIYRPEKKVEVKAQPPAVEAATPAKSKTAKPKDAEAETPAKPKSRRPGRPRSKKTKESAA